MACQRDTRNADTHAASQPQHHHKRRPTRLHHTHRRTQHIASHPHSGTSYNTRQNTHRRRDHASLHAASPNVEVATDVVLSFDTNARLGSPLRARVSVCVRRRNPSIMHSCRHTPAYAPATRQSCRHIHGTPTASQPRSRYDTRQYRREVHTTRRHLRDNERHAITTSSQSHHPMSSTQVKRRMHTKTSTGTRRPPQQRVYRSGGVPR
jgi:hypothetical protein